MAQKGKIWAANQGILGGVKALVIESESGAESKESQIILSVLFYGRGLTPGR
jgi:hypothetical protein